MLWLFLINETGNLFLSLLDTASFKFLNGEWKLLPGVINFVTCRGRETCIQLPDFLL